MAVQRFSRLITLGVALLVTVMVLAGTPQLAMAATAEEIDSSATESLEKLYASSDAARLLRTEAKGILVFPHIVKAGLLIGGQFGEGALRKKGVTVAYYSTGGASFGLQAGAQAYGYALFFMTDDALRYLDASDGWEIGVGPSVVIVDEGMGASLTTTTARSDVYAFIFDQKGLMAGIGLQGNKITRIDKR
jgi:lipid-binding SYLF domain-containing protein